MADDHEDAGLGVSDNDVQINVAGLRAATVALNEGHLEEAVLATQRVTTSLTAAITKILHDAYPDLSATPNAIPATAAPESATALVDFSRLLRISMKLNLPPDQALDWMEWLADQLPTKTKLEMDPAREAILRETGILDVEPAWHERASLHSLTEYALMTKESWTIAETSKHLDLREDQVLQKMEKSELYSIEVEGEKRFPQFQFGTRGAISGLDRIFPLIPRRWHPLQVLGFLNTDRPELAIEGDAVSPMVWLQSGRDPAAVVALASKLEYPRG